MKVYIVKEICDDEYFCREVVFATLNEDTARQYCEANNIKNKGWDKVVRDTLIYEEYELKNYPTNTEIKEKNNATRKN